MQIENSQGKILLKSLKKTKIAPPQGKVEGRGGGREGNLVRILTMTSFAENLIDHINTAKIEKITKTILSFDEMYFIGTITSTANIGTWNIL